jgi:hypothetical protein
VSQDGEIIHATRRQTSFSGAGWMDGPIDFNLTRNRAYIGRNFVAPKVIRQKGEVSVLA